MSAFASFFIKPSANETVETVIHLHPDPRPSILGTVQDGTGQPVEQALITLYVAAESGVPKDVVGSVLTDEFGQFTFGPLNPGTLYQIKVFKNREHIRLLQQENDGEKLHI